MDGLSKGGDSGGGGEGANAVSRAYHAYSCRVQRILDKVTPFHMARWVTCLLLLVLFMYRVVALQGFYIVAYVLGIFLLNQFILFLTPVVVDDMDMDDDDGEGLSHLPTRSDEEFRPFMRRLPEFKFWYLSPLVIIHHYYKHQLQYFHFSRLYLKNFKDLTSN